MRLLGWILMLVGGAVVVYGIYLALSALVGLYQANLADPLNQPENAESQVSRAMLRGVLVGAGGAPVLLAGVIMSRVAAFRRRRARRMSIR